MTRTQRLWLGYGSAALAAGGLLVALTLTSDHDEYPGLSIALGLFVGWSFVLAGLIGWTRRPTNRTGMLMVALGFGVFVGALTEANHSFPFTLGVLLGSMFLAVFVHLLLAYPSGALLTRYAQRLVLTGYATALLAPAFDLMFRDEPETCKPNACPDNLLLVSRDHAADLIQTWFFTALAVLIFCAAFALLVGRWRSATPTLRRILRPVYLAGGLSVILLVIGFLLDPVANGAGTIVEVMLIATFTSIPFLFLAGLLRSQLASSAGVGRIFWEIPERPTRNDVQEGFRRAMLDPSLLLAYWYPDGGHYVDVEGNHFDVPEDTATRAVSRIEYADTPVAVLVHDAALKDEPELLDAIIGAARIALERDRLQVEAKARAERYGALLQAMPDLMFRISRDGTYLGYNAPNDRDLLVKDVVGLTVRDRLPPELAERIMAAGEQALSARTIQTLEYELDFDGEIRHYEGRIASSGGNEFLLIVREITERKRHQQELEASRARIVAAGDDARRKLERNLHDGAQQRLVSLSLSLRLAQTQLRTNPEIAEELLESSREELAQALAELRELARGIHPAVLTDRGLDAALEALAARAPLPVEIQAPDVKLPAPVEAAAYYVVSEALANVTKYAQASLVKVSVERANGYARVEVVDDGVGGADPAQGSGLRGLQDRVASLNGTLEIESRPGSGTRVRAEIPFGVG